MSQSYFPSSYGEEHSFSNSNTYGKLLNEMRKVDRLQEASCTPGYPPTPIQAGAQDGNNPTQAKTDGDAGDLDRQPATIHICDFDPHDLFCRICHAPKTWKEAMK